MTDVFVTLRLPYLCPSEGHKYGIFTQGSLNLGGTLLRITREWKTAETWCLARLFIWQSFIISQILDFLYWMVSIFSFDYMTGENRVLKIDFITREPPIRLRQELQSGRGFCMSVLPSRPEGKKGTIGGLGFLIASVMLESKHCCCG